MNTAFIIYCAKAPVDGIYFQVGINWVTGARTHALVDSYSYVTGLQRHYNITKTTYMLKEQVSSCSSSSNSIVIVVVL